METSLLSGKVSDFWLRSAAVDSNPRGGSMYVFPHIPQYYRYSPFKTRLTGLDSNP